MARTAITVQTLTGPRASYNDALATIYEAADATNDHEFTHPGGVVKVEFVNESGATMNVTITAVAGSQTKQMAQDITLAVADGGRAGVRIAYDDGYVNSTGKVDIDIDQDTTSYLGVFKVT